MTPHDRALLEALAAKYHHYFATGAAVGGTPEEWAAGARYPDTLDALAHPNERRMPEAEIPSTTVCEWWTAPESHCALGDGIERWEHRNAAWRTEAACLDAIEAWARAHLQGPDAAAICHRPTYLSFEDDRRAIKRGAPRADLRLIRSEVTRREHGVLISSWWERRLVAVRQEPVSAVVDGVECKGARPVEEVIDDWRPYNFDGKGEPSRTSWAIEAKHHTLTLKWGDCDGTGEES